MRRSLLQWIGAGALAALAAWESPAAEPVPRLDFDFGARTEQGIPDRAGSGLVLKPGAKTRLDGGALIFDGTEAAETVADEAAYRKWLKGIDRRELSGAFWIRFDRVPSRGAAPSLGLFDCRTDKDGRLELALPAAPTEIMADELVMRSQTRVERGKWYHVEFNYSANRRRYSLYLDGRWQVENDQLVLPVPTLGPPRLGRGFQGAIRDLKVYDAALESEALAIADTTEAGYAALRQHAAAIAGTARNPALKGWANTLGQRADALQKQAGRTTIAQIRALERDISNAEKIAAGLGDEKGTLANAPVTSYILPATTQDLLQPYDLPRCGRLSRTLDFYAAQGEFESALLVVVPFRPVKAFTLRVGDLRDGARVVSAASVDAKLVKRWFRSGGAWMTYHADKRQRVLVPDLLINDDRILRVDEIRASNELLMRFPRGDRYVDVSRYDYDQVFMDHATMPFRDAPSLQPLDLPEAGRNQPYCLTFHVPGDAAPGLYAGKIELLADGQPLAELAVNLRVLPFALPEPKTYYDLTRTYFSHINSAPTGSPEIFSNAVRNLKEHNLLHASRVADTPWQTALAKQAGYPLKELVSAGSPSPRTWQRNFGGPAGAITSEEQACLDRLFARDLQRQLDFYDRHIGPGVSFFNCGASEASSYGALVHQMEQGVDAYHATGRAFLMTHGMGEALPYFTGDFNDMDTTTHISREWADLWHAAGGRIMNYANPFPGAENPAWFRRRIGLQMYKDHYDGQMLHGYVTRFWNEFAEWPGGDGNYRNFGMAYAQQNGIISTLALLGAREAYDDVRYATRLQELALAHRDGQDVRLAREARRQLHWLERLDGEHADMDAFRAGAAHRILTLMELIKIRGGGR